MKKLSIKVAAVGDIHVGETSGLYTEMFQHISKQADVLLLCGDLTHNGLKTEAENLAKDLRSCTIPVVAVLGNHDYEGGQQQEIREALATEHVTILEGQSVVIKDVGFAGIKGFCGGFDNYMLTPWGEQSIKSFVKEAVDDSLKLESALMQLETELKVVIMHYSPIRDTVVGESEEIFPFLGSSRFASVLNRFKVNAAFHGHAHHGTYEGKTSQGIPVYNVAHHLMQKISKTKPYALLTIG